MRNKFELKIEVFAICYNEEILLPYFLRHYSTFCDKITIFDNYSTDRSEEICKANPKVEVIKYDSGGQIRDDLYLKIKNNCWKGSTADWVIVCDIDEMLIPSGELTVGCASIIKPLWFDMVSETLPTTDGQIYDELHHGVLNPEPKCLVFRPNRIQEINYLPGAHFIEPKGDVCIMTSSLMKTLHYKYISLEYVLARYALFALRLSAINKRLKWGFHYLYPPEQITAEFNDKLSKRTDVWENLK
jgi:glycosyltransferase involved in cell wall biosynthesis